MKVKSTVCVQGQKDSYRRQKKKAIGFNGSSPCKQTGK